jgi:F0F1-type ATP synthase delta subunit
MRIPRAQLAAVIGEKTLKQKDLKRLTQAVAAYLMEQNSIGELESLMRDVLAYRQARGIIEAEVTSAHDLSKEALAEIKHAVKEHYPAAKHVQLHESLDEQLIGGVKVSLAHEQLDLSVRAKIDTFKRLTTEGTA